MAALPILRCTNCAQMPISTADDARRHIEHIKETTMGLRQSYNRWRQYRQTCNELGRMDDRELRDIGITRSDIPFVARQSIR